MKLKQIKKIAQERYLADKSLSATSLGKVLYDEFQPACTYETFSRDIRRAIAKVRDTPAEHTGLQAECEAVGIPLESVDYYWFKGQRYSIHSKNNANPIEIFKTHIEDIKAEVASDFNWGVHDYGESTDNKLLVVNIFDLHLGKLAWGEETGEDYDINIAQQRFKAAIEDLVAKTSGHKVRRILFPVGNDIYNSDKAFPFAQTTGGTAQHDDSRWQKMFRTGSTLITWATIRLSEVAPVDIVTVFSNHDFERVFYLGEVLSAVFANNPNVTVDNTPKVRKYYKWGQCLLGLAHGHNEKPQDLPIIMAQEARDHWADTWYREWLLGHLHHKYKLMTQEAKDYRGVRVTYLTSPSAPDSWHYNRSYIGAIKGAEAFVYEAGEGLVGTAAHNIR